MNASVFDKVLSVLTLCGQCGNSGEERCCGNCLVQAAIDRLYLRAMNDLWMAPSRHPSGTPLAPPEVEISHGGK